MSGLRLLAFYALLFSFSCNKNKPQFSGPNISYVVETMVVKPTKFAVERRYIGTIKAEKFSVLSSKSLSTVEKIHVNAGAHVKKGDLLISLKGGAEKAGFELAKKSLHLLVEQLERYKKLYRTNDITKSELDRLEGEVLASSTRLEDQRRSLENVQLTAPFDGIVGVPRVVLGETIAAGSPLISITEGEFLAFINIPASRLLEVKVGQSVRLKDIKSTITAVEKSIDEKTRVGFAKASFSSCDSCIIGDSVYLKITVHEKDQALLVNRNAIYYKDQKPQIVVVKKDKDGKTIAQITPVTVGEEQDGLVEVVSGLNNNDEIVSANPKRIPDKATLTVLK